ncbi:MAG: hypothetical protein ACLFM1_10405 [Bacteroidales bacterium]
MKIQQIILMAAIVFVSVACDQKSSESQNGGETTGEEKKENPEKEASKSSVEKTDQEQNRHYVLAELETGKKVLGKEITEYDYKPHDEYHFRLDGEFLIEGRLQLDEMSDQPAVIVENEDLKDFQLEVEGQNITVFSFIHINNETALKEAMDDDMLEAYNSGKQVPVKMSVNHLEHGGKIDGYGSTNTDFIAFE